MDRSGSSQRALRAIVALIILACAVYAGFLTSTRLTPDWLRETTEGTLANAFNAPVQVQDTHIRIGEQGLSLEIEGLEAHLLDDTAHVRLADLRVELRLFPLLAGRIRLRQATARGLFVQISAASLGKAMETLGAGHEDAPYSSLRRTFPPPASTWRMPLGLSRIELTEGRVEVSGLGREGSATPQRIFMQDLTLSANRPPLRHDLLFDVRTRLQAEHGDGAVEIALKGRTRRDLSGNLQIKNLDLTRLLAWLPSAPIEPIKGETGNGRISGTVEFQLADRAPASGRLELTGEAIELPFVEGEALRALHFDEMNIAMDLSAENLNPWKIERPRGITAEIDLLLHGTRIELASAELDAAPEALEFNDLSSDLSLRLLGDRATWSGGIDVTPVHRAVLSGWLGLPLAQSSTVDLTTSIEELTQASLRNALESLPVRLRDMGLAALHGVEAGTLHNLSLHCAATLGSLRSSSEEPPPHLTLEGELRGGRFRSPSGQLLEEVHGFFDIDREEISISESRATQAGEPTPTVDLTLLNWEKLRIDQRDLHAPMAKVESLPGLAPLFKILFKRKRPPGAPPRQPVDLKIKWIFHPAAILPLHDIEVRLLPRKGGVDFREASLSWGDATVRVDGSWRGEPEHHLSLTVEPLDAVIPVPRRLDGSVWIKGSWNIENANLGHWPYRRNSGSFEAQGALASVDHQILIAPVGEVQATYQLTVDDPEAVPVPKASITLRNGDLASLGEALIKAESRVTGALAANLTAEGKLVPGDSILRHIHAKGEMRAHNGQVRTHLPFLLSIAKASESFNPFGSNEFIAYDEIEADFKQSEGALSWDPLMLKGPDLRLLISGKMDLIGSDPQVDALVGVMLFGALDKAISIIPIVNRILLGPDKNLVGTYFKIEGPRSNPQAKIIPTRALVFGPAQFAFKDIPSFLSRAVTGEDTESTEGKDPPEGEPKIDALPTWQPEQPSYEPEPIDEES